MSDRYRLLYRDGDTLFFKHGDREIPAMLDGITEGQFTKLSEAFHGDIPAPLLEAVTVFHELRFDILKESSDRRASSFSKIHEAGQRKGFAQGFKVAESIYAGDRKLPEGSGRACAACGTLQESKKCVACGHPTWKMKMAEAWFYGLGRLTESAEVSFDAESGITRIVESGEETVFKLPLEEAKRFAGIKEAKKESILRFTRARAKLVESRWSNGFGCFSRSGSRVNPVDMVGESFQMDKTGDGKIIAKFTESGRHQKLPGCCTDKFVKAVSTAGMKAHSAAGLMRIAESRAVREMTTSPQTVPIGRFSRTCRQKELKKLVGDLGVVEYDPKKGMSVIAIPRKNARVCTPLKEMTSVEDMEPLDKDDPDYEMAAEIGVAAGDPDPEVVASCEMIAVLVPVFLVGEGDVFSPEEIEAMDTASDGEEHFIEPGEDESWSMEESKKAISLLESKGLLQVEEGICYKLTEAGKSAIREGE